MEVEFQDDKLDRLEIDAGFDGQYPPEIVTGFRRRMQQIRAAVDERDFINQRSLRFERLAGKRRHQFSIRINNQWRLILEFKGKGASKIIVIVSVEDYH
jgi:proteic killer suppression protein